MSPVSVDDAKLLQMAVSPRRKLFPTLSRASAFAPLIVVCCIVPSLLLLGDPVLNEEASIWGLRNLSVANSTSIAETLEPGLGESGQPLMFQPPLVAWLNGSVIRLLGPSSPFSFSLVSLVATGVAIWLTTRCAWRVGGANTALIAALLMCSHPFVLESAISPVNGPAGYCLLLTSVFGLQRHQEGNRPGFSLSLLLGGFVWGLALLAIGPVAFSVPLIFAVHAFNPFSRPQADPVTGIAQRRFAESRRGQCSVAIFAGIGLLVGGWWEVLMLLQYGTPFLRSWWSSLAVEFVTGGNADWQCDLNPHMQPNWREWLTQSAMLLGWMIVGLERAWHEWYRPHDERSRQRCQLLMLWWWITFCGRVLAEFCGLWMPANTAVWNAALLVPVILLASLGIGSLIERAVSRRGEFFLIVLMVSLTVWRLTMSWTIAIGCTAIASVLMVCGPMIFRSTGRTESDWTEDGWRQLLQFTVYGSLVACLSAGPALRNSISSDEMRLAELNIRLKALPEVRRISVLSSRDPVPITLRYVLRRRWPKAELVATEGEDTGLTQAMEAETAAPRSSFLVLEWMRRDVRLDSHTGQAWQISAVGDPMRFQGRRLSLALIEPRR